LHPQQPPEHPLSVNPDFTELSLTITQPSPRRSSALEPKIPLPTKPPPSQPFNAHPSPAAAVSSADQSKIQDNDHNLLVDAHKPYEQRKKPSEDSGKDSEVANGNSEQLSTLAQGATTLLESTTTETLKPFPDLLEQEHTPPSQKQPNDVPSKQDPTANPNPNLQPDNQPDWQMVDSSTGADMVNPNQVSFDVLHVRFLHCIN